MLDKQTLPTDLHAPQPHSAFFVNKAHQIQIDREVAVELWQGLVAHESRARRGLPPVNESLL